MVGQDNWVSDELEKQGLAGEYVPGSQAGLVMYQTTYPCWVDVFPEALRHQLAVMVATLLMYLVGATFRHETTKVEIELDFLTGKATGRVLHSYLRRTRVPGTTIANCVVIDLLDPLNVIPEGPNRQCAVVCIRLLILLGHDVPTEHRRYTQPRYRSASFDAIVVDCDSPRISQTLVTTTMTAVVIPPQPQENIILAVSRSTIAAPLSDAEIERNVQEARAALEREAMAPSYDVTSPSYNPTSPSYTPPELDQIMEVRSP